MELKEVTHLLTRILHRNDKVNDFFLLTGLVFSFSQMTKWKAQIILWSWVRERYCNYGLREGRRKEGAEITC